MKKSKIAVTIAIAALAVATVAVGVTAISNGFNSNNAPTDKPNNFTASTPIESPAPTENDTIRNEIKKERSEKKQKLYEEMISNGKNEKDAMFDAEVQISLESANEAADILKEYNKLDSDFTFASIDDNVKAIKTTCELLNSSDAVTSRESVILEMYLEEG